MPTVVVVENQNTLRELITGVLEGDGYRVLAFNSGDSAWVYLSRSTETLDLIFTDVMMPGELDGFRLAAHARQRFPSVPIVISSAFSDVVDSDSIAGEPPVIFPKPWGVAEFQALCSRLAPIG